MEPIDYIKKFNLDQENYQFKRDKFLQEFGKEFLEYAQNTPSAYCIEPGIPYYFRFKEIVKNFEIKFWSISKQKKGKPFTRGLWNAFFAKYVCPFRNRNYPGQVNRIKSLRARDRK